LNYLSSVYPGIEYPYPQFTTFVGVTEFDGMEFPMMANNGVSTKEVENTDVTFHELAHSYFPFLMGINEVKYSWMEEGWTEFFTIKFIQYYNKGTIDENAELNRMLISYNKNAGLQWDAPLITPSFLLTYSPAHGQLSYRKPAFMYLTLENILGEDSFKKCLKTYINRWRGKHPTPYDFMFTFNEVSNQNLNWFWKAWIFEPGYGDLGLVDIENSKLKVKNIGSLPVPIILRLTYKNGIQKTITKTATIWNETKNNIVDIDIDNANELLTIELVTDYFPDADEHNNILKIKQ
jgi:aminopeptidase N